MKKLYFIPILLFSVGLMAQNTDQQVIASSGGYHESGDYSISWTLGETVISTLSSGDYTLTQGFQQSTWDIIDQMEEITDFANITVFPNPAVEVVNIKVSGIEKQGQLTWHLTDLSGRKVNTGEFNTDQISIPLHGLSGSTYIISIRSKNQVVGTYKVVKN